MTTTSFQTCQDGRCDVDLSALVNEAGISNDALATTLLNVYAADTLRIKTFAGQRKFQAPVADDFTRGLLAPEHAAELETRMSNHATCTWAALINGLTGWWRG